MQKHIENNCFKTNSQGKCFPLSRSPLMGHRECCPNTPQRGSQDRVPASGHLLPYAESLEELWKSSGRTETVRKREKTAPKVTQNSQMLTSACRASLIQRMYTDSLQGEIQLVPTPWYSNWVNVASSCTYLSSADQLTGHCILWAGNLASTFSFLFFPSAAQQFRCFSSIPAPVPYPVILAGMLAELKHKTALILSRDWPQLDSPIFFMED